VVTEEKSNEITAIPKLLRMLELRGAIVTRVYEPKRLYIIC
jgi:predicted transposase YbfD/YdcC